MVTRCFRFIGPGLKEKQFSRISAAKLLCNVVRSVKGYRDELRDLGSCSRRGKGTLAPRDLASLLGQWRSIWDGQATSVRQIAELVLSNMAIGEELAFSG